MYSKKRFRPNMTKVLRIEPEADAGGIISDAAQVLANGGLCAFPTETVYGLGASRNNPSAVARLDRVKQREGGKHYTLMLADRESLGQHVKHVPLIAEKVVQRFWPGPLTIVFGDEGTEGIGIRVPASRTAREIVRRAGVPVLVTSANISGRPPATSVGHVLASLDGLVDLVVDEGETRLKEPSTVVVFREGRWEVTREGLISREMIAKQARVTLLFVCTGNSCRSPLAEVICRKQLCDRLDCSEDDLEQLGYRVISAGTQAVAGQSASEEARLAAREIGCSLADHTTRPLTEKAVREADRIYTMTKSHLKTIQGIDPGAEQKTALLGESEIADPIGGDGDDFRQCAQVIEDDIRELLDKLI